MSQKGRKSGRPQRPARTQRPAPRPATPREPVAAPAADRIPIYRLTSARIALLVLLAIGALTAVVVYWPSSNDTASTARATATATVTTAASAPAPTPLTSEQARAEYYRLHPKSTGWWQWVLIGGLLVLLVAIGVTLLRAPPRRPPGPGA